MQAILLGSLAHYFFAFLLSIMAIFLIGLILLQRGRGGGLSGALGGAGGQSAFGSKTGDVFTKVTIGVAFVWIALIVAADKVLTTSSRGLFGPVGDGANVKGDDDSSKNSSGSTGGLGSGGLGGESGAGSTGLDGGLGTERLKGSDEGLGESPSSGASTPAEEPAKRESAEPSATPEKSETPSKDSGTAPEAEASEKP